jgi:hypothetical protein
VTYTTNPTTTANTKQAIVIPTINPTDFVTGVSSSSLLDFFFVVPTGKFFTVTVPSNVAFTSPLLKTTLACFLRVSNKVSSWRARV